MTLGLIIWVNVKWKVEIEKFILVSWFLETMEKKRWLIVDRVGICRPSI